MQIIKPAIPTTRLALIVGGRHPYFVLERMMSAVALALAEYGYAVVIADAEAVEDATFVYEHRQTFDFCIYVGAPALAFNWEGQALFSLIPKPQYYWLLDPIFYDLLRVPIAQKYFEASAHNPLFRFLVPDLFSKNLINSRLGEKASYFPFGGFNVPIDFDIIPKRSIAVFGTIGRELAAGAGQDLNDVIRRAQPVPLEDVTVSVIAEALSMPGGKTNVADVIISLCQFDPDVSFSPSVFKWISEIDAFLKRNRRISIIMALADHPVDFYGAGWSSLIANNAKWTDHGEFAEPDMGSEMQKYSVVLNFDPNWDNGMHDRFYTALGSGVRVLTNRNTEIPFEWIDRGDVMTYDANTCEFDGNISEFISRAKMNSDVISDYQMAVSWSGRISKFLMQHSLQFNRV